MKTKTTIILTASLVILFSLQGNASSKSRLDSIDCGPRMSRLDADKCKQRRSAKATTSSSSKSTLITPQETGPEWDTQGRHYTPAGGGNLWRDDGTLMQKAAGGYIDTKTGQFIPAN